MAKQNLMWTALPNGLDANGNLRVSALLSPRLTPGPDQTLKSFVEMLDWPRTMQAARFTIHFGAQSVAIRGNETAASARLDTTVAVADSSVWTALFHPDTYVAGYVFQDHVGTNVLSYDTVAVHSLAQNLYSSIGSKTSDALPKVSALLGDSSWQGLVSAVSVIDRTFGESRNSLRNVEQQFAAFKNGGLQSREPVVDALMHVQLFHTPPSKPSQQDYTDAPIDAKDPRHDAKWLTFQRARFPEKAEIAKRIDFHQIIAAMNQYPKLLRLLGVVVDFVIPRDTFTESANQQLWVTCDFSTDPGTGAARIQGSPRTRTRLGSGRFDPIARPSPSAGDYRVRDGLLMINSDLFAVLQTDVDAAGLKLMNFARTLRKLQATPEHQNDAVTKHEKDTGVPALRNAGLMLVQRRRGQLLTNAFNANKQKNTAIEQTFANNAIPGPDLFAEDLIRGWRMDVWDRKTAKWQSLCERHATYTIGGGVKVEDDSEGIVRLAATKAADGNNPNVVYLHEALISWTGWSLVAQQPGLAVDNSDATKNADAEVPPGIHLKSAFIPRRGSLPRLRYGRSYWVRARMVDLAGNSLPPNPKSFADEQPEKNAVRYTRFDPVQSPAVALLRDGGNVEKPLEGESMERVAIRSFNDTPPDNALPTTATARRFVVPARSNVRDAELHGMLDTGGTVDGSTPTYDILVKKDVALEEIKLATPGPLTDPGSTVETSYSVVNADATEIPYLPDPLCTAICARIFDHPGFSDTDIIVIPAFKGAAWPHAEPFTIRIFEDAAQVPHFDADSRVLQIPLPKAIRATLRLSCQLAGSSVELMGIWNWIPTASRPALLKNAQQGQHWMLTPWRNVELVHAVQRPLIAPEMKLVVNRAFGATRAIPRFTATCSIKSTARIDLEATWHEPDGDSSGPLGADRLRSDHAFSVKITDPQFYATIDINPSGGAIAEHDILAPDLIGVGQNLRHVVTKFHELNDTRYRRIEYWLEATTRFREFMPSSVLATSSDGKLVETDEKIKVTGPVAVSWVPNSSPPPAPKVLYVVPTFAQTTTKAAQSETHWRRGGGLRVYLDRPWNSSGYGEMLGVVLPPASFAGDPTSDPTAAPYKHVVTQWGNDPIWSSNFVNGPAPKLGAFPLARTGPDTTGKWLPPFAPATEADQPPSPFQTTGLPHPGMASPGDSGQLVDVAPHDVVYDPERQLWYADLEVNAGSSYYPMIRLALAKYQPVSVSGAHLSTIVLADVMALTPDRWLTISSGSSPVAHKVSVFGFTYTDSSGHAETASAPSSIILRQAEDPISVAGSSVVEVWIEKLDPSLGEDFGWKRDATASVIPTPATPASTPSPISALFEEQRAKLSTQRNFSELAQRIQELQPIRLWPQLWEGSVTLPANVQPGDRYRLAVAEFEEYIVDDATPYNKTPSAKDRRIVFLQYVPLG